MRNIMSEHLDINEVTQIFSDKIKQAPPLTGSIKVIIENVGNVYLEHVDNINTASNRDDDADCGVQMSADTYTKLINGELSGMAAFMQGKLNVEGDMSIAMNLGNFI